MKERREKEEKEGKKNGRKGESDKRVGKGGRNKERYTQEDADMRSEEIRKKRQKDKGMDGKREGREEIG